MDLFLKILNMSISASWLILAVILLRFVLKKAPKWINVLLWALVAVRLLCPVSFESSLSLVPNAEPIPQEIFMVEPPEIHESPVFEPVVNPNLPDVPAVTVNTSIDQVQNKTMFATFGWIAGVAAMLVYATISYILVRHRVRASLHLKDRIWICDHIPTPFILGVFKPRIYIPSGTEEAQFPHIVAHENAHLKRRDHWWKPLGFLVLAIHWFNPLVWLAYILLCRDIELACDEKVIRDLNQSESISYAEALLSCGVNRRTVMVCPLAFGEVGVKERVKRVLNYKKPAFWILLVAVIACVAITVCFLTNPRQDNFKLRIIVPAGSQEEFVYADEEISTIGSSIKIWSCEGLGDTEVLLTPVDETTETGYTATYLTHGMPAVFDAEKDTWFRVGINMQNPTNEDIVVYVEAENIEIRGSDESTPTSSFFNAEILEVYDGYFLVKPVEGSWELSSADQIEVPIKNANPSPEPQIGDIIEIEYSGEILETYPARIADVYGITVVEEKTLSLNDVIILSQKGYDLTWADFEKFAYIETGSGLYIRVYEINDLFKLWIGGAGPAREPMYIYLALADDIETRIDIRAGGVTDFISKHNTAGQNDTLDADRTITDLIPGTTYVSWQCLYMNPLTSYFAAGGDSGCKYVVGDDYFAIYRRDGNIISITTNPGLERPDTADSNLQSVVEVRKWKWKEFPYTDQEWTGLYNPSGFGGLQNIREIYDEILYQPLIDGQFLLRTDGDLLLVETRNNAQMGTYLWSIYSLIPESAMGVAQWEYRRSSDAVFPFAFDLDCDSISAVCTNGGQLIEPSSDMAQEDEHTLLWYPRGKDGQVSSTGTIHFTAHKDDAMTYAGTIYLEATGNLNRARPIYTASLVGTGLHLSPNLEAEGGVISAVDASVGSSTLVTEHDLRSGGLEVKVEDLDQYVFFTNSTKIAIKVESEADFDGEIILYDISQTGEGVLFADVDTKDKKALFSNLTSARMYRLSCEGLDDCTLVITEK